MRVSQTQFPARPADDASIPLLTERLPEDQAHEAKSSPQAQVAAKPAAKDVAATLQGRPTQPLPPLEFDVTLPPSVNFLEAELPPLPEQRPATATLTLMPNAAAPEKGFSFAPPSFPLPQKPALREVVSHVALTEEAAAAGDAGALMAAAQLAHIEQSVQAAVMQAVSDQLPQEVESAVRQQVSAAFGAALRELVEPLVARLSEEAQNAIAASLRQLVAKTLEAELARFKAR